MTEDELDLERAIKICRVAERASKELKELHFKGLALNPISVNVIKEGTKFGCYRCGTKHGNRNCPAYKKTCNICGREGHFAKMYKSAAKNTDQNSKVNAIRECSSESDEEYTVK